MRQHCYPGPPPDHTLLNPQCLASPGHTLTDAPSRWRTGRSPACCQRRISRAVSLTQGYRSAAERAHCRSAAFALTAAVESQPTSTIIFVSLTRSLASLPQRTPMTTLAHSRNRGRAVI